MKKILLTVYSVAAFFLYLSGDELPQNIHSGSQKNFILASVDGEVVTLMDVLPLTQTKEQQARSVYSGKRLENAILEYRKKVADELIDNILIRKEFERHNYKLSNQDIEREVDEFALSIGCRSREQLISTLRKNATGIDELKLNIRKRMMVQLMHYRQIKITDSYSPKELYDYFKKNEASFAAPEKVGLAMLKIDSSTADIEKLVKEIDKKLKAGPDEFDKLVAKYTPGSGNADLGEIESKLLRPEFASAFKEFVPGMIAGPLKIYGGVVWLKITSYVPAKKAEFKDVEDKIKLELERKRREKVIADYAARLRSNAVIVYFL